MSFTSDNACVGIVYEEEARIGVHVRPFASLEVEVQLKAIRRDRAHATDEATSIHRIGADEVAR